MCIILRETPSAWVPLSNCWWFRTKIIVADAQMELWAYLKPCWYFMWRETTSWNIQHVSLSWFFAQSLYSQHRHIHRLPRGRLWWETRTFGQRTTYECNYEWHYFESALVPNTLHQMTEADNRLIEYTDYIFPVAVAFPSSSSRQ